MLTFYENISSNFREIFAYWLGVTWVWVISSPPNLSRSSDSGGMTIIRGALSGSANKLVLSEVEAIIYQRSQWEGHGVLLGGNGLPFTSPVV